MMLPGLLLLSAFVLLSQRRLAAMITLYQMEAFLLSAAAFGQGFAQRSDGLVLAGIITISVKGVLLPLALRRILHRRDPIGVTKTAIPAGAAMILGVALTGIAVLAVHPGSADVLAEPREHLAIALSVVLLGLLVMTTRRDVLSQVIGFLSTENGLMLAAIFMPGLPFVAALSVALLVLAALPVAGIYMFPPENFETIKQ